MNRFSRIRHHVDMKDVKKRHLEETAAEKITAIAIVPKIIVADLIGKFFIARTRLIHQSFY